MSYSGWSNVTIKTYLSKKWKGIIEKTEKDKYIMKDFEKFNLDDFIALQTQVFSTHSTDEKIPEFDYDVTLSFAGEDREYVEEVANSFKRTRYKSIL